MKKYLPSKRFGVALLLIVIAVGLGFGVYYLSQKEYSAAQDSKQVQKIKASETASEITKEDSDNDGVPDWEEHIWGTDPNIKDTDGDGTPDKQHIANLKETNTNQTSAQAKATSSRSQAPSQSNQTGPQAESATEKLTAEMFASLKTLQENNALTQEAMNDVSETAFKEIQKQQKEVPDKYSRVDIDTQPNTAENVSIYAQRITQFNKKAPLSQDVYTYIQNTVANDNYNENRYQELKETYKDFAERLTSKSVPYSAVDTHLDIANVLYSMHVLLKRMENTKDPIVDLGNLKTFQKNVTELRDSYEYLSNYFSLGKNKEAFEYPSSYDYNIEDLDMSELYYHYE